MGAWEVQREALGAFIRSQRNLARLSLRQLAELTDVSNAYLSQIERGLHAPSVRVLKSIADALGVSAEALLAQAGLADDEDADGWTPGQPGATEAAISADPDLTPDQRTALLAVYRSYRDAAPSA